MTKFARTPPRLDRIFQHNPLYFVTCCTFRRGPVLANQGIDAAFNQFAQRAYDDFGIAVGRYVIMPDHLHFFVCGPDDFILGRWVGTLKRALQKEAQRQGFLRPSPVWQRGFFDHVLRTTESYSQKWHYVWENPLRAGLVNVADDWPFCGEIVEIMGR